MVQNSLLYFDGERYRLSAWVIMPNHVHLMLIPGVGWSLSRIMKDMKSFTSREANKVLSRQERRYFGRRMPPGRVVATEGEVGIQADVLKPGLHLIKWPFENAARTNSV